MSLKEELAQKYKESLKNKDEILKSTVTLVRAAILQIEKDGKKELNDSEVLDIIAKEVKQRKDSLEEFVKAGREDLIEKTKAEIEILKSYLPKQLSKAELFDIVKEAYDKICPEGMKDMGKIMADVMPKIKGRADGKAVNEIVKELLENKKKEA